MKPHIHAKNSVNKFGGKASDYLFIHDFIDSSKAVIPDVRHRAVFHSAFGIFIAEKVFGSTIKNSDGIEVSVRDIAEEHILEDLGFIPTLQDWLSEMKIEEWMISQELRNDKKAVPKSLQDLQKPEVIPVVPIVEKNIDAEKELTERLNKQIIDYNLPDFNNMILDGGPNRNNILDGRPTNDIQKNIRHGKQGGSRNITLD